MSTFAVKVGSLDCDGTDKVESYMSMSAKGRVIVDVIGLSVVANVVRAAEESSSRFDGVENGKLGRTVRFSALGRGHMTIRQQY